MEIAFTKLSPTQNVTVLVESPVPREAHAAIAARLLAVDGVGGEQAGFLEPPSLPGARMRLQMMGGEFCGNASMSTAALLAWQDGLPDGAEADFALEVSGASGLTPCHIRRCGDLYRGTVQMPLPERIESVRLSTDHGTAEFPMAVMPGIVHVVAADGLLSRAEIQRRIRDWSRQIGADALGVLRWNATARAIEPIVYVPATDTAVWERGCGSGTAALGSWMAACDGASIRACVRQPGGEIAVDAEFSEGRVSRLSITGDVRIVARGVAYL